MLVDRDFAFEEDGQNGVAPEEEAAPLVVIQQRRSGLTALLVPPALILATAATILAYRVRTPDWRGLKPGVAARGVARTPSRALAKSRAAAEPIIVRVEEKPAPPAPVPAEPPAKLPRLAERSGFTLPPSVETAPHEEAAVAMTPAIPKDPTRSEVLALARTPSPEKPAPPKPVAKPVAGQAWDDIRREAERKTAERAELDHLKRKAPELARQEMKRRAVERYQRARDSANADRPDFRTQLSGLVRTLGLRAAPRIRDLCDRFGRETIPEVQEAAMKSTVNFSRFDRKARIVAFRRSGLPEALILEILAFEECQRIVARDGPRNEDEALVRSARFLLAVPLATSKPGESAPLAAGLRRDLAP